MDWQGKINFTKPITINGKPHGVEHETSLPAWNASYVGRVVHDESDDKLWLATTSTWVELTPGGVGVHNHDDRYYLETEVDAMFEGKNGVKQQVNWTNVINRPSTMAPDVHNNSAHSEAYLTAGNVDFTLLQNNSLVGSGANQIAVGNHAHTEYSPVGHTHTEYALTSHDHASSSISYDNTTSGITATNVKDAIDHIVVNMGICNETTGIPADTPAARTMRFDIATNTLYIFNGTAWVSVVLS